MRSAPDGFAAALGSLPIGAEQLARVRAPLDVVVAFFTSRAKLLGAWPALTRSAAPAGVVWVAWPKRSSGVATDITEDTLRADLLPTGWVDTIPMSGVLEQGFEELRAGRKMKLLVDPTA